MAQQRSCQCRLPGTRLTYKTEHGSPRHDEVDTADDVDVGVSDADPQVADIEEDAGAVAHVGFGSNVTAGRRRSLARCPPLSIPPATLAIESVKVFIPIVSRATNSVGAMTAQGLEARPIRFSLIITPQSAVG